MKKTRATTDFGKELKMIRVEKDEISADMAGKLDIAPSLLSAIETGARKIPVGFVDKLAKTYGLKEEEVKHLKELEDQGERNAVQINFRLLEGNDLAKQTALVLAEKIQDLSPEQCKKILSIMEMNGQRS
jgi:HTH-type transcriptional regulator, competence development regulator